MKPKIAFCISGQARTFDATLPYFQKFFFEAAEQQGFEYDIFLAVEDDKDLEKTLPLQAKKVEKIKSSEVTEHISKKYGQFIKNHIGKDIFLTQILGTKLENMLQQFYKLERADLLRQEHEKKHDFHYDIVFRLRFDLLFFETLDFEKIRRELEDVPLRVFVDTSPTEEHHIHDQFVIGSSRSMSLYSPLFREIENILEKESLNINKKIFLFLTKPLVCLRKFLEKKSLTTSKFLWNLLFAYYTRKLIVHGITPYTCEMIVYKNLMRHDIKIEEAGLSFIMVRDKREQSGLKLCKDSPFLLKEKVL